MKKNRILSRVLALALTLSMLPAPTMAASLGDGLTGANKYVYDELKSRAEEIAKGTSSSPVITLDNIADAKITTQGGNNPLNSSLVMSTLLADLPYELYWFDKIGGMGTSSGYNPSTGIINMLQFSFSVGNSFGTETEISAEAVKLAKAAYDEAVRVKQAADVLESDYEKLKYCFEYIKKNVIYGNPNSTESYPWQMLCVFDQDSTTNPVCEGYAKAFKYLCDCLDIDCYLVSGTMNGGDHMWNIVTLDGQNYMVDVTNCDESPESGRLTIGQPDLLFLKGYQSHPSSSTYVFKGVNNSEITFVYDSNVMNLFSSVGMADVLNISGTDYTPGTSTPGDDTPGTDTPGTDTPGDDTPGTDTPGTDTPGTDTPGDDTPGTDTPGTDTPGDDIPDDDTPGTDTPDTDTPGDDTSEEGKFPVYDYAELVNALAADDDGLIMFKPDSNFAWPASGTLTIPASVQDLDVLTPWEIPEGITVYFESSSSGINCEELTIRGSVSAKYTGIDSVLAGCKKVIIDSPAPFYFPNVSYLCRQHIPAGNVWEVKKNAVLNADIYLNGSLNGEGTVSGQVNIQGGYIEGQSMHGYLSGNLTLENYVMVGRKDDSSFSDRLTIPGMANLVFKKSLILGNGTVDLKGKVQFAAPGENSSCNLSIHEGGTVIMMGGHSEILLNAPANISIQAQAEDDDFILTEENRYEVPCYIDGEGTIRFDTGALAEGADYHPMSWTFDTLNTCVEEPDKLWLPSCYVNFHDISVIYDKVQLPVEPDEPEIPEVVTYTVTFNSNGGSAVRAQTVEEDGKAAEPAAPKKAGCRFEGWYDITGGKFDFSTPITADTVLTAKWTKVYTVTFELNGIADNYSVSVDEGCLVGGNIQNPTRQGYEFAGWYLNDAPFNFETPVTEDITLTARWTKDGSLVNFYTVSFDTGVYGLNIAPQKVEGGSPARKPADPVRSGYNFLHWLLDSVKYDFAAPVAESITLTALWEKKAEPAPKPEIPSRPSKPDYDDDDRDYVDMTGGGSGSGSSGSSSSSTTEKNPDGSTTTTTKDGKGTVVENTKYPDGSTVQVKTTKDGTVTTTEKDAKGNQTETVEKSDGSREVTVKQKDGSKSTASVDNDGIVAADVNVSKKAVQEAAKQGTAVQLPIPAVITEKGGKVSTVDVELPKGSGKVNVVIPVAEVTPGTVAVIVYPDGTEEVVIQSKLTGEGLGLTLEGGASLKIMDNSKSFDDVKPTDWFNNATDFVSSRNLFAGTSETEFSPNAPMTMEMLFAVAHNFMGKPEASVSGAAGTNPEDWFHTASNWAAEIGLTSGLKMDMLGKNQPISREDTAILLFNLSGKAASYIPSAEALAKLNAFTDIADMDPAHRTALAWAVENGIMNGMGDGTFGFKGSNTRAQTGAVMMNFNNNL